MGEVVSTILTIGFNVETVQYDNIKFRVWDLGGQTSIRPYWRCYFPNTRAVIYIVDSSGTDRIGMAKEEFHSILEEEELKGAVILIFANKQDLPGALDDAAVTEALELRMIKNRQWAIFKTCAVKGEGHFKGLNWISPFDVWKSSQEKAELLFFPGWLVAFVWRSLVRRGLYTREPGQSSQWNGLT